MIMCGSVNELSKALYRGHVDVALQVNDISIAFSSKDHVYLFLSKDMDLKITMGQWEIIRNHVMNRKKQYFKDLPKYQSLYI